MGFIGVNQAQFWSIWVNLVWVIGFGSVEMVDILLVDKSVSWESHSLLGTSLIESSDEGSFLVEAFDRSHDSKCKFHFAKIHVNRLF